MEKRRAVSWAAAGEIGLNGTHGIHLCFIAVLLNLWAVCSEIGLQFLSCRESERVPGHLISHLQRRSPLSFYALGQCLH